jgi:hypothetical protein
LEEIKEVVQIASAFLKDLFEDARDVRLEQVEESRAGSRWSVVLSYPDISPKPLSTLLGGPDHGRIFKEVVVDSEEKKPVALKVWKH